MKLSEELKELILEKSLLQHPFYRAWSAGQLSKDDLRYYAGQYYRQVEAFPRWVSSVHSRCPNIEVRKVLLKNLVDEEIHGTDHPALWMQFAAGLGLTRAETEALPPSKCTQETIDSMYQLTSGDWAAGICALFAYEQQVPDVSQSKIEGLKQFYGISDPQTLAFFEAHLKYDVEHSREVANLVDVHAPPEVAKRATHQSATALWKFLDGVSEHIGLSRSN